MQGFCPARVAGRIALRGWLTDSSTRSLVLDGPYADEKTPLGNAGIEYEYEYDGNEAGAEGNRQIGLRVEDLALACPVPCRTA